MVSFRATLGYVPEDAHLYTYLSGLEYLQLVGRLRGLPEALIDRKAMSLLRRRVPRDRSFRVAHAAGDCGAVASGGGLCVVLTDAISVSMI
jgi:hypothetical protein